MVDIKRIENIDIRKHDNLLSLNDLITANNAYCLSKCQKPKRLDDFFSDKDNYEYASEILSMSKDISENRLFTFKGAYVSDGLKQALKSIGQYKVTGRGANKTTFCNPYIFVAVAQWLNPKFRAQVTMWVTDSLILNRIEAGTQFNELCTVIKNKIIPQLPEGSNGRKFIFSNFAKLINKKVFGKHETNLRQIATKDQLLQLARLEGKLSALIDFGSIVSYQEAKDYIKKLS